MSATERSRNVAEMRVELSGAVASSASMRRLEARFGDRRDLAGQHRLAVTQRHDHRRTRSGARKLRARPELERRKAVRADRQNDLEALQTRLGGGEALAADLDLCGGAEHEAHGSTPAVSTP